MKVRWENTELPKWDKIALFLHSVFL